MSPQARTAKRQPREMKLLAEYNAIHNAGAEVRSPVRLGAIDAVPEAPAYRNLPKGFFGSLRRWADAIVVRPDRLVLQEAKIRPDVGVVSQMQMYKRLVPLTPELRGLLDRPLELELVIAVDDPSLVELARDAGITVRVFSPPWVAVYLEQIYPREGRPKGTG